MKSKDELNAIKEEIETMSRKLSELTEDELAQVSGGIKVFPKNDGNALLDFVNWFLKIRK